MCRLVAANLCILRSFIGAGIVPATLLHIPFPESDPFLLTVPEDKGRPTDFIPWGRLDRFPVAHIVLPEVSKLAALVKAHADADGRCGRGMGGGRRPAGAYRSADQPHQLILR
jgi:hypothetical protein